MLLDNLCSYKDTINCHTIKFFYRNGFVVIFGLLTLGTNLSTVIGFKHITQGGKRMLEIINRTPLMTQDEEHDLIIVSRL